jgi:hypothetical protein
MLLSSIASDQVIHWSLYKLILNYADVLQFCFSNIMLYLVYDYELQLLLW